MDLTPDLRESLESLNSKRVEYVVVGGYAQAYHGRPRFTGDIDVLVRPSRENAARVKAALAQFGFGQLGLEEDDFVREGQVIQLGIAPNRIDILTPITGCQFDEVWRKNQRATGRPQDLADLDALS